MNNFLIAFAITVFSAAAMVHAVAVNQALVAAVFGMATGVWIIHSIRAFMNRNRY